MFEESIKGDVKVGGLVNRTVVLVSDNDVVIDIDYKSEGHIPINQFIDGNGKCTVAKGDEIDVIF